MNHENLICYGVKHPQQFTLLLQDIHIGRTIHLTTRSAWQCLHNQVNFMEKYLPVYVYGILIVLSGVFLLFSNNSAIEVIRWTLGITFTVGAAFAIFAAFSRQRRQVQFAYHEMHALTMLVYGVSLLLFGDTLDKIILFSSFLFIFYTFSEIIFCNWLFNLEKKMALNIIVVRLLLGLAVGMGAVVAINYTAFTLPIFGVLFMMVGVNIILYVPVMKGNRFNAVAE